MSNSDEVGGEVINSNSKNLGKKGNDKNLKNQESKERKTSLENFWKRGGKKECFQNYKIPRKIRSKWGVKHKFMLRKQKKEF